jgi:hypothetical protein
MDGRRLFAAQLGRDLHMWYRIAMRTQRGRPSPAWRWQSTTLSSLNATLQWLQYYRVIPRERLRVFTAAGREALEEQLDRANRGLASASLPAADFALQPTCAADLWTVEGELAGVGADECGGGARHPVGAAGRAAGPMLPGDLLERVREAQERGAGGDRDLPYRFSLPTVAAEVRAWARLLARAQHGDLRGEVAAVVGRGQTIGARLPAMSAMSA